jgi:hypothetical protein
MEQDRQNAGYALIIVLGLTAAATILLAAILFYSSNQMRIAVSQANLESALYVAQAGAERAAAYVANGGGSGPWSSSGHVGDGTYVVAIVPASLPSDAPRTIGGWIDINPSSSPQNEFVMRKPDGTMIDRLDLGQDFPGYTGPAVWVHVKPKGGSKQNLLMLDGVPYQMDNQYSYDIFAGSMDVYLYNDKINPNGKAMGKWKIAIATTCASFIVAD